MEYISENISQLGENITDNQLFINDGAIQNYSHSSNYSTTDTKALLPTWWKLFDEKFLRHSFEWTTVLVISYMFILVTGIVGNVMVILVIYLRPKMRSVTNIFILNLAVADLFVIVFCVPPTLMSNVFAPWILGSFMCKGVAYVQGVSVCASAYSLAAISLDRCKAIYKSHGRSNGLSRKQGLFLIFLIWIFAAVLTIPWAIIFEVTEAQGNLISFCVETWSSELLGKLYFLITNFLLGYCFPLLLISISNLVIWCHVNNRKVPRESDSSGSIRKMHRKARHGVVKMLSVVTLVFLLSWLPLHMIVMRLKFAENISDGEYNLHGSLMPFAQWLGSWNSSVNPILYAFLNKKFRKMFRSLLPSWIPFVRQSKKNFITRGIQTQVTLRSSVLRTQSTRTSIYTARSSRNDSQNSRNSLLDRQASRNYILPSNNAALLRDTGPEANETIAELSTSSVESIENKNIRIGAALVNSTIVVITSIGKVTDL